MSSTMRRAAVAALALVALSGCSLLSDENDFTRQSARSIAEQSFEGMKDVTSVRLLGTVRMKMGVVRVDLRVDDTSCTGTFGTPQGELRVRRTADGVWFQAEDDYWRAESSSPEHARAVIARFGGKWVVMEGQKDLERYCTLADFMEGFHLDKSDTEDTLDKGEIVKIGEDHAIAVTGSDGKERVTTWIDIEAPHHVLKIAPARETAAHEELFIEEFGTDVEVTTPPKKDIVRAPARLA